MSYPIARLELKPSKLVTGQVGLFALVDIKKDEIIVSRDCWDESRLITWDEFENLEPKTKEKLTDFCYKTEEGIYAPQDINRLNMSYYFNHHCDPNSFSDDDGNYIAKRDIAPGEELTIDVELLMKKTIIEFDCHCGSSICRRRVKI